MKKKMIILLTLLLSLLLATTATAAPATQEEDVAADLLAVVRDNDRLDKLETLVEAVSLDDNLADDGPYTIFAPTDAAVEAFENQEGVVEPNLAEIVSYHVVEGYFDAGRVLAHDSLTTIMGDHVEISVMDGTVMLDGTAAVIETNIQASNGVIHLIDTVLIPELEGQAIEDEGTGLVGEAQELADDERVTEEELANQEVTLSQYLLLDGRFDILYGLLEQANLLDVIDARNDFTLMAPTDAAFAEVSTGRLETIMNDESILNAVLLYHVVGDSLSINQIATDDYIPTLLPGRALFVEFEDGVATINGAEFTDGNVMLANGTLHAIDSVLSP